ncbi:MAG: hypothetical protein JXA37_14685 [Chloroflexia bacterium]|nr:hypothetical protein [Chloroflexia bacterium]
MSLFLILFIVLGVVVLVAIGALVVFVLGNRSRPARPMEPTAPTVDGGGLEQFSCQKCGAALESSHITTRTGERWVACPYCGAEYRLRR